MSKLIKKDENPLFQFESFEAAEISQNQGNRSLGNDTGSVRLPLAEGLRGGEDPKEKRARLEKEAYEKGFEQGRKDGLALEKRQMEEKGKLLDALMSEISQLKARICSESEGELLKLSMLVAKRIIREEVKIDSHIIGKTIQSALKYDYPLEESRKVVGILNKKLPYGASAPIENHEEKTLLNVLVKFKSRYHFRGISKVIVDVNTVLRPALTVIDGFVGMEGRGPVGGDSVKMDLIIAGKDPVATDATACRTIGIDPLEIAHILRAYEEGLGNIDDIEVLGERLEDVTRSFKR